MKKWIFPVFLFPSSSQMKVVFAAMFSVFFWIWTFPSLTSSIQSSWWCQQSNPNPAVTCLTLYYSTEVVLLTETCQGCFFFLFVIKAWPLVVKHRCYRGVIRVIKTSWAIVFDYLNLSCWPSPQCSLIEFYY